MHQTLLFIVFSLLTCFRSHALEVSREIPEQYKGFIEEHLTVTTPAYDSKAEYINEDDDYVCLLKERVSRVNNDGSYTKVSHIIYRALSDEGAKNLRERYIHFTPAHQDIYLIKAHTIQEDGTVIPIAKDASFIKSAEDSEDLYNDDKELNIIFSDVKKTSTIEFIVCIVDKKPIIPNEYFRTLYFDYYHPVNKINYIINFDKEIAKKLNFLKSGEIPTAKKEQLNSGRTLFSWQKSHVQSLDWESGAAPLGQNGPLLKISTWKSWDDFHQWYSPLLTSRSQLNNELKAKVNKWVKGHKSPQEILNILLRKVADNIRYTGLEFGLGGYQPHDCNKVWKNQYGDCKDKANLLRVMLATQGIKSYLCLLNTSHLGKFYKKSPSYHYFSHAILAVEFEQGKYTFCDPTIPLLKAGSVGSGSFGREVALVKDNNIEFTRIPTQNPGGVHYSFDLSKRLDGDLSGWLTLTATDYWSAIYSEFYWNKDLDDSRNSIKSVINRFFPAAKLIDLTMSKADDKLDHFSLKAYFVIKGGKTSKNISLLTNDGNYLFPSFNDKTRTLNAFERLENSTVSMIFSLPKNFHVGELPPPIKKTNKHFSLLSRWQKIDKNKYKAKLEYKITQRIFPPKVFIELKKTCALIEAWTNEPLIAVFKQDSQNDTIDTKTVAQLDNFPMLSSAKNQMDLIDENYPLEGNLELRKKAIKQVLAWFPKDKKGSFDASIQLGETLHEDKKYQAALELYETTLKAYKDRVSYTYYSWGEYMKALCLTSLQRKEESSKIFLALALNPKASDFRRGWSYYELAQQTSERSLAIAYLKEAIKINSNAYEQTFRFLINQLSRNNNKVEVDDYLKLLLKRKKEERLNIIAELATYPEWYLGRDEIKPALLLNNCLRRFISQAPDDYNTALQDLNKVADKLNNLRAKNQLYSLLKNIDEIDFPWWPSITIKPQETVEAYEKVADRFFNDKKYNEFIKASIFAITELPINPDTFTKQLWMIPKMLMAVNQSKGLDKLLFYCRRIPKKDSFYLQTSFLEADIFISKNQQEKALKVYENLLKKENTPNREFKILEKRIELHQEMKLFPKALEDYKKIEQLITAANASKVWNLLFKAICINLNLGNDDEALRLIAESSKLSEEVVNKTIYPNYINDFTNLYNSGKAKEYWQFSRKKYKTWTDLKIKFKQKLEALNEHIPLSSDEDLEGMASKINNINQFVNIYDRMIAFSRWLPTQTPNSSYCISRLAATFPAHKQEMYKHSINNIDCFSFIPETELPNHYVRKTLLLLDANKNQAANELAKKYLSLYDDQNNNSQAIYRLHAVAATRIGQDCDIPMKKLETLLSSSKEITNRMLNVQYLGLIYSHLKLTDKKMKFYQKELESAGTPIQKGQHQKIYDEYHKEKNNSSRLNKLILAKKKLFTRYKPAWYDHVTPHSLDDEKYLDLKHYIDSNKTLTASELFKIHGLAIETERLTLEQKVSSMNYLLDDILEGFTYVENQRSFVDYIVAQPVFHDNEKSALLYNGLIEAYTHRKLALFKRWKSAPLLVMNGEQKKFMNKFQLFLNAYSNGPQAVDRHLTHAIKQPFENLDFLLFKDLLTYLTFSGSEELYKKWHAKGNSIKISPNEKKLTTFSIKLQLLRQKKSIQTKTLQYKTLKKHLLSSQPKLLTLKPQKTLTGLEILPLLSYEESLQQQVHFLKQGRLEDNESSEKFWISLLQNKHLAIDKNLTTQCLVDLINLLKNNDDKNISKILLAIIPFFNEVSTPNKKLIAKAAIQFSNPQKFPESSSLAKIFEFDIRIHNGDNIDFQQFFKNTKGGFFNSIKASVALEFYLAKNDLVTLKMLIEEMSEDDLFNWHTCRTVIYSLTELQKNDELELIKAALEEQFLAKLYEVWYYKDYPSFIRLLQNAKALKLKNHPTLAYAFKDFCTQVKEPENLLYVKALYAELNEDWQGLEELFDSSSQIDLNQKRFLFLKGTAAAHLNKPAIARENLQKFIALEKFDYEVILAQRLLETLR